MNTSTNYGFNLPVGTDLVNLLTQLIPNWSNLDTILRNIQNDTFENATETVALGVHALTRLDSDAKLIKWVATANYTAGETFTVDGTPIAAATPSGNTLATGAYVSGSIVIAAINSDETAMTIYVTGTNVATDSERLGGELPSYYATDSDMDTAQQAITDLDNLMGSTSISAIGDGTVTGAIDQINEDLTDKLGKNLTLLGSSAASFTAEVVQDITCSDISNYQHLLFVMKNSGGMWLDFKSIPYDTFKTLNGTPNAQYGFSGITLTFPSSSIPLRIGFSYSSNTQIKAITSDTIQAQLFVYGVN